jgi:hypothetical protein
VVSIINYHYTALQVNVNGAAATSDNLNTGQDAKLEAWGLRSDNGIWERVTVSWTLTGLVDQNYIGANPPPGSAYDFQPKSPGIGNVTATLTR